MRAKCREVYLGRGVRERGARAINCARNCNQDCKVPARLKEGKTGAGTGGTRKRCNAVKLKHEARASFSLFLTR